MVLGREDREKINEAIMMILDQPMNISMGELVPELDYDEGREYLDELLERVSMAINNTINTMNRTISVYIDVESTDVDDAIEKVKNYLPKPTGSILCWEIDVEQAWDFEEKGDH